MFVQPEIETPSFGHFDLGICHLRFTHPVGGYADRAGDLSGRAKLTEEGGNSSASL